MTQHNDTFVTIDVVKEGDGIAVEVEDLRIQRNVFSKEAAQALGTVLLAAASGGGDEAKNLITALASCIASTEATEGGDGDDNQ